MDTYFIVIIVANLAGTILLVGLVTWQGILIKVLREDMDILNSNIVRIAIAHNGLVDKVIPELESLRNGQHKPSNGSGSME